MKQLILITGFLGSGKTTFLANALKQTDKKVGVLMNEFGNISIDTSTVTESNLELKELTNGSIFCSCLKEQFIDGLIELLNKDIEIVFVESSGIADPSDMEKVIEIIKIKDPLLQFEYIGTVCMVDGINFLKAFDKMLSVQRQIKHSHKIVINKMDLIDESVYKEIVDKIKEINKSVEIISTIHSKLDWEKCIPNYFKIDSEETTNTVSTRTKSIVITLKENTNITVEDIKNLLNDVSGHFYRAKGYVVICEELFKIDQVGNEIDISLVEYKDNNIEETIKNKIVFLSSRSLKSIATVNKAANKYLKTDFDISM